MKDYYATLGVTPQAEDVVIKAAYRALAQRYHPDRYAGSADDAHRKMAEINEAYEVLSEAQRRKAYDADFFRAGMDEADFDAGDAAADEGVKQLDQDWETALEYYPDLANIEETLAKTSKSLAFTFRLYMIVQKDFKNRNQVAQAMHQFFLSKYFGEQKAIVDFAKTLIAIGRKDAAKALNEAVRVLGDSIDPALVIQKIKGRFGLLEQTRNPAPPPKKYFERKKIRPEQAIDVNDPNGSIEPIIEKACHPDATEKHIIDAIKCLGGEVSKRLFGGYTVDFRYLRHQFESPEHLSFWFLEDIAPIIYFTEHQ